MVINFLKIFYRNLIKHKTYVLINVFGLAFSLAAVILLILFIRFELSFDNFHKDGNRIYRISVESFHEGKMEYESYVFTPPIGVDMKHEFGQVENYTRYSTGRPFYINKQNTPIQIDNVIFADSTFLYFFSFPVMAGNTNSCLKEPFKMVLTEKTALKLFGKTDVVGNSISTVNHQEYLITAVVKDPPENSSVQFNALASFSTLYADSENYMGWNGGNQYITFIKLCKNADMAALQEQLPDFMWRHINKDLSEFNVKYKANLQPVSAIHLKHGDFGYQRIYFFVVIGLLILMIASFNFINLSTGFYMKRTKEVGVRKTFGAGKKSVIMRFLFETFLIVFIALLVAILLAKFLTPYYQNLIQTDFYGINLLDPYFLGILLLLVIIVGLIAGSYPAFYLSSIKVADLFKENRIRKSGYFTLQNMLMLLQFVVALSLIIFTLVISSQLNYINHKDLGFDRTNIIVLSLENDRAKTNTQLIEQRLKSITGIKSMTASSEIPSGGFTSNGYFPEGFKTPVMINVVDVDKNFLDTYGIKIVEGRNFSDKFSSDKDAFLVNEALVKKLGWKNPIGKIISRDGKHKIIGVVKNFNFASLHQKVAPLILTNRPWNNQYDYLSIKLNSEDYNDILLKIKSAWKELDPRWPFEYYILNNLFDKSYQKEFNMMKLFIFFSVLSILIAAFGLYALSALSIEQRTKEIGIRKVHGATLLDILILTSKKYLIIILIANLLAWPAISIFINSWLSGFENRINFSVIFFIEGGVLVLLVSIVSVFVNSYFAVRRNPINSLRNE